MSAFSYSLGRLQPFATDSNRPIADIVLYLERGRRIRFLKSYLPHQYLVCEVAETDVYPANE